MPLRTPKNLEVCAEMAPWPRTSSAYVGLTVVAKSHAATAPATRSAPYSRLCTVNAVRAPAVSPQHTGAVCQSWACTTSGRTSACLIHASAASEKKRNLTWSSLRPYMHPTSNMPFCGRRSTVRTPSTSHRHTSTLVPLKSKPPDSVRPERRSYCMQSYLGSTAVTSCPRPAVARPSAVTTSAIPPTFATGAISTDTWTTCSVGSRSSRPWPVAPTSGRW
mmetsp:Transcript_6273/g.22053  ORF Transcript_6273/g.22053 Transcript_6273/m.22053 type:complete len:220 (+) Transcript_6273:240-899(+)